MDEEKFPTIPTFNIIFKTYMKYLDSKMRDNGITSSQFPYFMEIYAKANQTQNQIANSLIMSEATVARTLRKLEEQGLVKREIDENNRRKNIVNLTEEGEKLASQLEELEETWEDKIYNYLTDDEANDLKRILNKLRKELRKEL